MGGGKGRLLVVDDERAVLKVVSALLDHAGFQVKTAASGPEALAWFDAHPTEVDAALLDLAMPEMDGAVLLRELRRRRPELPIILTSGYAEQTAIDDFAARDYQAFMRKPYRPRDLVEVLRSHLPER